MLNAMNPTMTLNHRVMTRINIVAALAIVFVNPRSRGMRAKEVNSYIPTPPGENVSAPMIEAVA